MAVVLAIRLVILLAFAFSIFSSTEDPFSPLLERTYIFLCSSLSFTFIAEGDCVMVGSVISLMSISKARDLDLVGVNIWEVVSICS
jgi:hypothetical protein